MYSVIDLDTLKRPGREGPVYQCKLRRGSKVVAEVFQGGDGAPTDLRFVNKVEEAMFYSFVEDLPAEMYMGMPLQPDGDCFIGKLAAEAETAGKMRRLSKTRTVFRHPGTPEDEVETYSKPFVPPWRDATLKAIKDKYPDGEIYIRDAGAWVPVASLVTEFARSESA